MGPFLEAHGGGRLTRYLLDTTVLIAHLRGDEGVAAFLRELLASGHTLGVCCENIAEIEHGIRTRERRAVSALLDRLTYLETNREAARRAGRYQSEFRRRGTTIHTADALVAGTARAHGAVLVTDNIEDFPMRDVKVLRPPAS